MCEHDCGSRSRPISRRRAIGLGAAAFAATLLAPITAGPAAANPRPGSGAIGPGGPIRRPAQTPLADALRPGIHPRSDWAGDLGVNGTLTPEEDVRFLLVHHTASTNDYGPEAAAEQIRGFHSFHTGPEKGWPDVAYNFFVDRHGAIWEGRQGSLAGPVRGDATGGSQGFALLCCLIGDFTTEPVTEPQRAGLVALLAWLAESYAIDTAPGAQVSFVSRGSNRWPAGDEVTTATISGHRDMSMTSCPGDAVYATLATDIPTAVSELRATAAAAATTTTTAPTTSSTAPPTTAPTTSAAPVSTTVPGSATGGTEQAAATTDDGDDGPSATRIAAGAAASAAVFGTVAWGLTAKRGPADRGTR